MQSELFIINGIILFFQLVAVLEGFIVSFLGIIKELSLTEAKAILRYVLNKSGGDPYDTLRRYIRYKRTKKAIMFILRSVHWGFRNWHIFRYDVGFRKIQSLIKRMGLETANLTRLVRGFLGMNTNYVYYVTNKNLKLEREAKSEGVLMRLGDNRYFLASQLLAKDIDRLADGDEFRGAISRLLIPPYKMNKLMRIINRKVISAVFSLNPQITGVYGVEEIEVRGPDVLNGLAYLVARLDKLLGLTSFFGPLVQICFDDGLMISCRGTFTSRNLNQITYLLEQLSSLRT